MESDSYRSHSFDRRCSCTLNVATGRLSMLRSHSLSVRKSRLSTYLPSPLNLMSEMLAMISEKKLREPGASASSNILACALHSALRRMSARRMLPLLEEYANVWHCVGWKLAHVITSVRSSMFAGLMSTTLNAPFAFSRCQRLTRKSSADKYVSPSELTLRELTWYACALPYRRRHFAPKTTSVERTEGNRRERIGDNPGGDAGEPSLSGVCGPKNGDEPPGV